MHARHGSLSCPTSFVVVTMIVAALLGGCASIPDVAVSYRPVKWALLVTVAQTTTCNRENDRAIVDRGVTFLPIYSAAPADTRFRIQLKELDRFYADADVALAFTDDGRLKSVNQSTTGQGETIVKSAITAMATVAAVPTAGLAPLGISLFSHNVFRKQAGSTTPSAICRVVRNWSQTAPDQLAQVSLVQTAVLKADSGLSVDARPSTDQQPLLNDLKSAGLDLSATVVATFGTEELQPIGEVKSAVGANEVPLTLQRMVSFGVVVSDPQGIIGSKSIPVPTKDVFVVPIPKAALFGKQSFSLALTDSGRISSLGYGRTSGVAGSLGAVASIAGAETTEDNIETAAMKAAADLIAQQQRYNNCKLKPADCK